MALLHCVFALAAPGQYLQEAFRAPYLGPAAGVIYALSGDFNNNGKADLIYRDFGYGQFLYLADPAINGFGVPIPHPVQTPTAPGLWGVMSAYSAHIDGDGNLDLIIHLYNSIQEIYLYLGQGNGNFPSVPFGPLPFTAIGYTWVIDANGDGAMDILCDQYPTNPAQRRLILLTNNHPTWTQTWSMPLPYKIRDLETGDFDGDGFQDVSWSYAVNHTYPVAIQDSINIAYGNGNGTFTAPVTFSSGIPFSQSLAMGIVAYQSTLAALDFDGDGRSDLALDCHSYMGPELKVFYGNSNRTLSRMSGFFNPAASWYGTYTSIPGDFDRDGIPDLLVQEFGFVPPAFHGSFQLRLVRGLGHRQFSSSAIVTTVAPYTNFGMPLLIADEFDGDGDLDIIGSPSDCPNFYFQNRAISGLGCAGVTGGPPVISIGDPSIGNSGFSIGISNAAYNAPAVLGLALAQDSGPLLSCGIHLDFGSMAVLLPGSTSGIGAIAMTIPIPSDPALHNATFFAQWAVADPLGPMIGGINLALSSVRTIIIW